MQITLSISYILLYQLQYGYKELLEATFEEGFLKDIKDISTATEEINNSLPEDYVPFIIAFEPAPISKDLIKKYWWLKEE